MLNPDNATLEWCAKWIEDSLRAETNERTIEFGRNMAMTIRAIKTDNSRVRVAGAAPIVDHHALIQLLDAALVHPELAEANIRQVIEMLATAAPVEQNPGASVAAVEGDVRVIEGPSSTEYEAWLETRPDLTARFETGTFKRTTGYEIWRNAWLRLRELITTAASSALPAEPPRVVLVDREVAAAKAEGAWANTTHLGRKGESDMYEYACQVAANKIRSLQPYAAPAEPQPEGEQEKIRTHLGDLPLSLIDEIYERRLTIYKGFEYRSDPRIAGHMKTDLDYLMAFAIALKPRPAATPPETPVVAREISSRLVKLAARVIAGTDFISPDVDDNPKSTPRAILDQAEKQKERLRVWAIEIREVADALIAATATAAPVEQSEEIAMTELSSHAFQEYGNPGTRSACCYYPRGDGTCCNLPQSDPIHRASSAIMPAAPVAATGADEGEKIYDDSQPVHAALSTLIDDGYATDKQRQTARLALALIENHEDELDKEFQRWQDGIRNKLIDLGAPDYLIDGAGCDSGDPLDFTLAEVGQGVRYFTDQLESGYWPTLRDYADGVRGHFCIGRLIKIGEPYWEYWNAGRWVSAGEVFVGRELAQAQLDRIREAKG